MSVSTSSTDTADAASADKPALETRHRGLLTAAVMGVSIIQLLDMTIANVALPHMRSGLGASPDSITWVLTSFIIAGVMVTPAVAWVSDRLGSRRVFLWAVTGFVLSSMLCGAATSLAQMVFFRALQGVCAAFIGPMSQTILFDINPPSKHSAAMAIWGMVVMIAPISGPILGGYLTDSLNWRWVFYINLPIGIPTLLLLVWLLPSRDILPRKLDHLGFLLIATALVSLQLMLDRGQHQDWFDSWEIVVELMIALSAFWMFLVHTLHTKNPLFQPSLFANPNFLGAFAFMFVLGVANVAIASILPTMYQTVYGYSPVDTGLLMIPRGCGVFISMLLANRLMQYFDVRHLVLVGYLIAGGALWSMSGFALDMGSEPIMVTGFIQGLGLGLIFTPMNIAAFATVSMEQRPDGASLLNLMRNLGGSFGISLIITLLSRNTQTSHSDLASHITTNTLGGLDPASLSGRFGDAGTAALQMVEAEINRQAVMIGYLDNFHLMAIGVLCVAPVVLLLKPMKLKDIRAGG